MTAEKTPKPDPVRRELERLALGPATSGRARLAKVTALRTLDRLDRLGHVPPCPARDWHPYPGSEWEELDRVDHPAVRERWFRNLYADGQLVKVGDTWVAQQAQFEGDGW